MKNIIFISPNFPTNYWQFCRELKNNGMNVLGIGDQPYDEMAQEVKDSLHEYYKVYSLENEDEVYRAVAFLHLSMAELTGWSPTMNTGWRRMPVYGQISTLKVDFRSRIFPESSINPG